MRNLGLNSNKDNIKTRGGTALYLPTVSSSYFQDMRKVLYYLSLLPNCYYNMPHNLGRGLQRIIII